MNYLGQYALPFKQLDNGSHKLKYKIDNAFFTYFEESEVKEGDVNVLVELEKSDNALILLIKLKGTVKVPCDRCLDYVELEIKYKANLNVGFGEETSDLTDIDENMILAHSEQKLELAQHFYEYIHLSLPYKRVHKTEAECNADMMSKLKQYRVNNEDSTDPRWDTLKNLLN